MVQDFELGGYLLPKDATVILHLHSVHHDATYWEAADEFRPERWIAEDGQLKKFDGFMPFSIGTVKPALGMPYTKHETLSSKHKFWFQIYL